MMESICDTAKQLIIMKLPTIVNTAETNSHTNIILKKGISIY